jgi:hypothetical protein
MDYSIEKSKEIESILPKSEYRKILMSQGLNLNLLFTLIEKRFNDIEDKVYKKKHETTRAQQMLLLHHFGFLEKLDSLKLNKKSKARLLSALLNRSEDNIEGDLTTIKNIKKSDLSTKENYEFLIRLFKEVGMTEKSEELEKILSNIYKSML